MLNGTQVSFSILFPDTGSSLTKPMVATVDPDLVEIANTTAFDIKDNITLVAAGFDVSGAVFEYTVVDPKDGRFNTPSGPDGFNGFSASFAALGAGTGAALFSVDILRADSTLPIAASSVSFTDDSVFVNLAGLDHVGGETISLLFGFLVSGNNEANRLAGDAGRDRVIGGGGNDTLRGDAGNDILEGGEGNDQLIGGTGSDTMRGGGGNDSYVVDDAGDVTVEAARGGTDRVTSFIDWVLGEEFENLTLGGATPGLSRALAAPAPISGTGNAKNNVITGNGVANFLSGLGGNDTLNGGDGRDTLLGGSGNDALRGGTGADAMAGGSGNDSYVVDNVGDTTTEQADGGTDTVLASLDWVLADELENLTLQGTGNLGGTGNVLDNVLRGNTGSNLLSGLDGNDSLSGGDGDDTLRGGAGADQMAGGAGDDTYTVDQTDDVTTELPGGGIDTVLAGLDWVLAEEVENLVLLGGRNIDGTGNDLDNRIQGNGGNNLLAGLGGDDTLIGNGGRDTLRGGAGADQMVGGAGGDTYFVDQKADITTEKPGGGTDTVLAGLNWTLADEVENLTLLVGGNFDGTGNASDNRIGGNSDNNLLSGLDGADTLNGNGGNDTMRGGDGADQMVGGQGDDLYSVDRAADQTIEQVGGGTDTVLAALDWLLAAETENLTLLGNGALDGTGNELDNELRGNGGANLLSGVAGNDRLFGGDGDDTLRGGTGDDAMAGGAGDDTYAVDSGDDSVTEEPGGGTDTVLSLLSYTLAADLENLTLLEGGNLSGTGNAANNLLQGNNSDNVLSGVDGADTLIGNGGNDTLLGGTGGDSMAGGTGDDVYFINDSGDTVTEAEGQGTDRINSHLSYTLGANQENLNLAGADEIAGTGNDLANQIIGNGAANLLLGSDGDDTLTGGAGADTLRGDQGSDAMAGGADNDIYFVDDLTDTVTEAALGGTDAVIATVDWILSDEVENLTLLGSGPLTGTGNTGANVISGNTGANSLRGDAGDDSLFGGDGNDSLAGDTGIDQMTGGAGDDVYFVDEANDATIELSGGGQDTVVAGIDWVLASEVEDLVLTGAAPLSGTGNLLNNRIQGNDGNNVLAGLAGADTVLGGLGNDTADGGADADLILGDVGDDSLTGGDGDDNVQGGDGFDTLSGGQGADSLQGGVAEDLLSGGSEADTLLGGAGFDILSGDDGDDLLDGGTESDAMTGGNGDDTYVVDDFDDTTDEALEFGGTDTVLSFIDWTLTNGTENLTLQGTGGLSGTGNAFNNAITGNSGDNTLSGQGGFDTVAGGQGNDTVLGDSGDDVLSGDDGNDSVVGGDGIDAMLGGTGNDTLDGGLGDDQMAGGDGNDSYLVDATLDVVTELAGQGIDTVIVGFSYGLGENVENLVLTGDTRAVGSGNLLDNNIVGNIGVNILSGFQGNDTLRGGVGGSDTLTGGSEADQFVIELTGGLDTISDFEDGIDRMVFQGTGASFATLNIFEDSLSGGTFVLFGDDGFFLESISLAQLDVNDFLFT